MGSKTARSPKSPANPQNSAKKLGTNKSGLDKTTTSATGSLAFKSFRTGTLITPNFEPSGKPSKPLSASSPCFFPSRPTSASPVFSKLPPLKIPDPPESLEPLLAIKLPTHSTVPKPPQTGKISDDMAHPNPLSQQSLGSPKRRKPQRAPKKVARERLHSGSSLQPEAAAENAPSTVSSPGQVKSSSMTVTPTKSTETPLTTPSPSATIPSGSKARFVRIDQKKKDIVISKDGVVRNVVRITERCFSNGLALHHLPDELKTEECDVAVAVSRMSEKERREFWAKNWVEINVDFRGLEKEVEVDVEEAKSQEQTQTENDYSMILQHIERLGSDFAANVKILFVNIAFPSTPNADQIDPANVPSVADAQKTVEFKHIEQLVAKLQSLTALKRLEIIMQTPSNTKKPLSIPQLNLILPFYDLGFTDWNIKWKTSFMTRAEPVGGWPIHYLDKERNKLLRERERISNAVFVTRSQFVSPEQ